jgi:hypothetical protein
VTDGAREFARGWYGLELEVTARIELGLLSGDAPEMGEPQDASWFLPWFLFNWRHDPEGPVSGTVFDGLLSNTTTSADWPGEPIALDYLREEGHTLRPDERQFIEAVRASPYSFHQVTRVHPGSGLELEDLLTDRKWELAEEQATAWLGVGKIVLARPVQIGGWSILFGCAPTPLPQTNRPRLQEFRYELEAARGPITPQVLDRHLTELLFYYDEMAWEVEEPPLPAPAGSRQVPAILHYMLDCPQQKALDLLKPIVSSCPTGPRDARRDTGPVELELSDRRADEADLPLGTAWIDGEELLIEVMSEPRAMLARARLMRLLGRRGKLEIVHSRFVPVETGNLEPPESERMPVH